MHQESQVINMSENTAGKVKQSFIAGSLTSSAGIFVSKLIGLFYIIPFKAIAGQENMVFYSSAFTYYNVLLQISSAGLPFAIAALVAKYINRNDYRTAVLVRRLSTAILMVSGFVMALIFMLVSGPLSHSVLGADATVKDLKQMQNTFVILSLALFLVPILYSYRGYYQGMKEMKSYAGSQVIEQFGRVAFLLFLGWLAVYVFHMQRIFSIYTAVLATSLGCTCALIYYIWFDRKHFAPVLQEARRQPPSDVTKREIVTEFISFGLPYLLVSILGNSQTLINTQFFIPMNTRLGMDYETAKLLYSIIEVNCDKLTSIPQVLSIGFSAGIVPYMTISLENRDWRALNRNIEDCICTVLYIALPICFAMYALARPIYYVMYGGGELDYGTECLRWAAWLALATTITPICNSMMLTLRFRRQSIGYLGVGFVVKCLTFYPLLKLVGYQGAILSSILCSATIIFLSLSKIKNQFEVRYGAILRKTLRMIVGCLCMNGIFVLLKIFAIDLAAGSRLEALAGLAVTGIIGVCVYLFVTGVMRLPQSIFHMSLKNIVKKVLRRA